MKALLLKRWASRVGSEEAHRSGDWARGPYFGAPIEGLEAFLGRFSNDHFPRATRSLSQESLRQRRMRLESKPRTLFFSED